MGLYREYPRRWDEGFKRLRLWNFNTYQVEWFLFDSLARRARPIPEWHMSWKYRVQDKVKNGDTSPQTGGRRLYRLKADGNSLPTKTEVIHAVGIIENSTPIGRWYGLDLSGTWYSRVGQFSLESIHVSKDKSLNNNVNNFFIRKKNYIVVSALMSILDKEKF